MTYMMDVCVDEKGQQVGGGWLVWLGMMNL